MAYNRYTKFSKITVTPTVTAGAYSAGDVVGGLLTFSLTDLTVNGGVVNSAIVTDDAAQSAALTLYLFDALPTTIVDNAAFSLPIAELRGIFSEVAFSTYKTIGGNVESLVTDLNDIFVTNTGAIYGYLVCTATPTFGATTDISVTLRIMSE